MIKYYVKPDENGVIIAQSSNLCLSPEEIEGGGWQPIPESIEGALLRDNVPLYKLKSGKPAARTKTELAADALEVVIKPLISAKIAETKAALAEFLTQNPLESSAHGGKAARYSITSEKQALLTSEMLIAQGAAAAGFPYAPNGTRRASPARTGHLRSFNSLRLKSPPTSSRL